MTIYISSFRLFNWNYGKCNIVNCDNELKQEAPHPPPTPKDTHKKTPKRKTKNITKQNKKQAKRWNISSWNMFKLDNGLSILRGKVIHSTHMSIKAIIKIQGHFNMTKFCL